MPLVNGGIMSDKMNGCDWLNGMIKELLSVAFGLSYTGNSHRPRSLKGAFLYGGGYG